MCLQLVLNIYNGNTISNQPYYVHLYHPSTQFYQLTYLYYIVTFMYIRAGTHIIHLTAIFYPILCYLVLIVLLGSRHRLCLHLVWYTFRRCGVARRERSKGNEVLWWPKQYLRCNLLDGPTILYKAHIISLYYTSAQRLAVSTKKKPEDTFYVCCLRSCLIQNPPK